MSLTTADRIIGAVERSGFEWDAVIDRTAMDAHLSHEAAGALVERLRDKGLCTIEVAAAVISLQAERLLIERGHLPRIAARG